MKKGFIILAVAVGGWLAYRLSTNKARSLDFDNEQRKRQQQMDEIFKKTHPDVIVF